MSEYILDMGNSSYQSTSGLLCADVSQLREEIVRCSDCKYLDATRGTLVPRAGICTATCTRLSTQIPLQNIDSGFCAWGEKLEA